VTQVREAQALWALDSPCPHCGAVSRAERSALLVWRCGVCGGPVVPAEGLTKRDGGELASLVGAQRARAIGVGWLGATLVFGSIASMAVGLFLLVGLGAPVTPAVVLGALALAGIVLAVLSGRRAARANAEARAKLEDAWAHVAEEVMRVRVGEVTAKDLAKAMQTDETRAEKLLARLSAAGRVRVEVRDDADLAYRAESERPDSAAAKRAQ
jgi:hypothetical protein